jgi:hypothetical protein
VLHRVGRGGSRLGTKRARSDPGGALAICDGGLAEFFDGLVDRHAGLFTEDFAEQHAERADVAAQRSFLKLAGGRLQFREALGPVGWGPE